MIKAAFWIAVLLGVVIGALRLVALRWWRVPSDDPVLEASIAPTLRGGDWVLLWRGTEPSFGSLVVCPDPETPGRVVVGRIAGEAGDTITLDGDTLEINEHAAGTETACSDRTFKIDDPATGSEVELPCDIEAMGGVAHMKGVATGTGRVPLKTTRKVTEGNVFLVSDNRGYPYDSRNYGAIPRVSCKESIFFRLTSKAGFFDVKNRLTYIR